MNHDVDVLDGWASFMARGGYEAAREWRRRAEEVAAAGGRVEIDELCEACGRPVPGPGGIARPGSCVCGTEAMHPTIQTLLRAHGLADVVTPVRAPARWGRPQDGGL